MNDAIIVAAARSPIARAYKGSLVDVRADDLAAHIASAAMDKVPDLDPSLVEDLYLGAAFHTGEQHQNLGRRVAVLMGRDDLASATVNRACASSLQSTRMAFHAIRSGEGLAFLSVGVECVSRFPQATSLTDNPRFAAAAERTRVRAQQDHSPWVDPRSFGALPDFYIPMGQTAENVADMYGISRADQDAWALRSQQNYSRAAERGYHARQITPVERPDGTVFSLDESPRPQTTAAALASLAPVFRDAGSVTAGNSCPLNDGAAALVVVSSSVAKDIQSPAKVRIRSSAVSGLSPEIMGLGPVEASRRALSRAGVTVADIDIVELNEAFAAQVVASIRELRIDPDRVNVNGGALALGHPFGMTGARLLGNAAQILADRDEQLALVTLCVGMGQGMAIVLERVE